MTIQTLSLFKAEISKQSEAYRLIFQAGEEALSLAGITADEINQSMVKLEQQQFKLCFCGQMNSGKSSLVNALLFDGREILPTAATVMTAVITQIEHMNLHPSQQEGIKIEFYSAPEWAAIKQRYYADPDFNQQFRQQLEQLRQKDIKEAEIIGRPPKTLVGINDLKHYIAATEDNKGGLFTPFVKQITLYINSPILENLTVVDTPGTNDPNEFRANITERWMKEADAVVYVSYAGQAGMDKVDIDFIERYMPHVAPSHRIFAINKVDLIEDESESKAYLEALHNHDEDSIRLIFDKSSAPIFTSVKAFQINNGIGEGSEDYLYYAEKLTERGFLGGGRSDNIVALREAIEQRLMRNAGQSIIASHQRKITCLIQNILNATDSQLTECEDKLKDTQSSRETIQQQIEKYKRDIDEIHAVTKELKTDVDDDISKAFEHLKNEINELKQGTIDEINSKLRELKRIDKVKINGNLIINDGLHQFADAICQAFGKSSKELTSIINRQCEATTDKLSKLNLAALSMQRISLIMEKTQISAIAKIDESEGLHIQSMVDNASKNVNLFDKILDSTIDQLFNTSWGSSDLLKELSGRITSEADNITESRYGNFKGVVSTAIDTLLAEFSEKCGCAAEERKSHLRALCDDANLQKQQLKELTQTLAVKKQESERLHALFPAITDSGS